MTKLLRVSLHSFHDAFRWRAASAAALLGVALLTGEALAIQPAETPVQKDSMLRVGDKNTNEGASPILAVSGSGNTRVVLDFGSKVAFPVIAAVLYLDVVDNAGTWGAAGKFISVHPLNELFTEGNGKAYGLPKADESRGSGAGVTWNCPTDTNIANSAANCDDGWPGGDFGAVIDSVLITDDTSGTIAFDVTSWYNSLPGAGKLLLLIKKDNDGAPGRIDFESKEGTNPAAIPPRLRLCTNLAFCPWYPLP